MSMSYNAMRIGLLNLMTCAALSTVAFAVDREVYDKPVMQQPGKTMHGKVIKVDERDANLQRWDVSVQNGDTGEVVVLHLDKTTTRKESQMDPSIGANVIVKYDERSRHAISFLTDVPTSH